MFCIINTYKSIRSLSIFMLSLLILCFFTINNVMAQTSSSAAGFGHLGSNIGLEIGLATGNQEMVDTYSGMSKVYSDQYLYNSSKTGCSAGSPTSCAPYCKYEQKEECLLCPLFAVVFNTVSTITANSIDAFSTSVARVVLIGFGVWLAIQILAFVSSIETRDIKDLLQSMITQGFVIILVVFILKTGVSEFFNGFINPIYETGYSLAQEVFNECKSGSATLKCDENDNAVLVRKSSEIKDIEHGLPVSMGVSIINTMTMMENRVRKFKALGNSLMCQSWKEGFILPKFSYLFSGLGIFVFSMLIIIGVPFLMVDAIFQLGVAGALLPMAVGCFAFRVTRQYSKKVWETFLNSMFSFLFISIIVLIVLGVLQQIVTESNEIMAKSGVLFDRLFFSDATELVVYKEILEHFNWTGVGFIKLGLVFLLAWSVMNTAKEFAGEFASSISETSIGSSIGTMAASSVKGMALKASKPLMKRAGTGAVDFAKGAVQGAGRKVRHALFEKKSAKLADATQQAVNNAKKADLSSDGSYKDVQANQTTTTKLENGKITQVQTTSDGSTVTEVNNGATTVSQLKNGVKVSESKVENGVVTETTFGKDGSRLEIVRSENFTVTCKYDKNGKLVKQNAKANTKAAADLLSNAKGDFSKTALNDMLKGMSEEQQKTMFAAVAEKINKNRINANNRKGKIISEEIISCDIDKGYVEIKKCTDKGEVIFEKVEMQEGLAKSTVTMINDKGKVTEFTSDGIHNKIEKFRLDSKTDANSLKDYNTMMSKREKDADGNYKKSKVAYGYTAWYRDALEHGMDYRNINPGMLSEDEAATCYAYVFKSNDEFGKAEVGWSFH